MNFIWQQKRRRYECDEPNWTIRNYENGFIYAVEDVVKPPNWRAIEAYLKSAMALHFGAVDIITPNSSNPASIRAQGAMILEVNTAPGLQSDTLLDWYVNNFKEVLNVRR